ncbi:chemotaxis protein CheW [Candidatus Halocynthiibacter alkanivorans]|jgi:purine-binding chemotaxis protein CheW|uniref:chemotaxis protein CheW n=1 Tax=Candidatus Halocynthiibacter alkanivorans TaxID=2267619 RepID=UPI000DF1E8CB|nr:chemotaxis protein CheW [Candidatus Halocynthiibacter alkanivorans]
MPQSTQTVASAGAKVHQLTPAKSETETLLIFKLSEQTFGIEVERVSEIMDPQNTARVPNADPLAPTLINVRGSIVPVLDLRNRLGMKPAPQKHTSRMLVIDITLNDEPCKLAVMVDEVEDVIEAVTEDLVSVPELGIRWPADCFRGVSKRQDKLVILLEASNVFALPTH